MENERKTKIISLIAVIVAVLGLTLAFAAMSRTLRINGTGKMDPVNWDIYFTNLSSATTKGEAQTSGTPTLATKGASITNMNVTLKKPGDSVTYTVDIVNDGDINAEISQINLPTLSNRNNQIFEFSATYTNEYEHGHTITVGDMLYAGETRNITIVFKYKDIDDESLLPSSPEAINLSYSINYVQSNKASTTTQQNSGSNYGEEIASTSLGNGIEATYYGGTPIAKADNGVKAMSYDNTLTDDVRYEGGTLVISGSGAMPDGNWDNSYVPIRLFLADVNSIDDIQYDASDFPILKYNPTNVVIEEGITKVGDYSFSFISSITNVSLPDGLLEIGWEAFNATSITTIRIPNSVKILNNDGEGPFDECRNLSTVYLPSSIEHIGYHGFTGMASNSIIYCETQEVANLFTTSINVNYSPQITQVIVDPTKFN